MMFTKRKPVIRVSVTAGRVGLAQPGEGKADGGSVLLVHCYGCPRDISGLVRGRAGKGMGSKTIASISALHPMSHIKKNMGSTGKSTICF